MTDNEQLERIKARCLANIALAEELKKKWFMQSEYVKDLSQAIAGWRSTIDAIDGLLAAQDAFVKADWNDSTARIALANILANWPEELL